MLETIMNAMRGGEFAAAVAAARDLIAQEPDHADAHHLLGLALNQLGDHDGAEAAIDQALTLAPDRAPYHVSRAMLASMRRDTATAREALGQALQQDPNQLIAYIALAQIAFATRDFATAEQHLRYAERLQPEHPQVLTLSAQLALTRGEPQLALGLLGRAAAAAPNDVLVQGTYGLALLSQKHFAFAEQALRNALAMQPQARNLRSALIQAMIGQGRHSDGEREVDTLLAQAADDAVALMLKGQFAAARGARAEAENHLMRALELQPGLHPALDVLLHLLVTNREQTRAEAFVEALVERAPQHDGNWSALLELQRVDASRAGATAMRWQTARTESGPANELAAQVAEAQGDYARAVELAENATRIAPHHPGAHLILVRADLREDRGAQARARVEPLYAAATAPPVRRALAGWLGRTCDAAGDYAGAVQAWLAGHGYFENPAPLPDLKPIDAALLARIDEAQAAATSVNPQDGPRLLWGAPGSGVERLVSLLGGRSEGHVLVDRMGSQTRADGFRLQHMGRARASTPQQQAERFAREWREGVALAGATPRDIDWLPHWDARLLPAMIRGLPDARLLVALRDPRDMLLNWLAFGAPQRNVIVDPVKAARWLARALEQFALLRARPRPSLLIVRMREMDTAPAQVGAEVAQFVGGAPPSLDGLQRARTALGGLPTAFPAGHWRHYRETLADAFAELDAVSNQLGAD